MSWEEMGSSEYPCDCGRGKRIVTSYMDDWNRIKDSVRIECEFCNSHHLYSKKLSDRTIDEVWITNEEYKLIVEQQDIIHKAEQRIDEIVDFVRYHRDYQANLAEFQKSAKHLRKGTGIRRGYKTIDVNNFLNLPLEVQEKALGTASRKSPYSINVLAQVPVDYWSDIEQK